MDNNRDICFLMPHFFFEKKGGAELQVYYLARELAFRGFQVNYIRENNKFFFGEKNYEGIKLYTIYIPKFLAHPRLLFAKQILRRIQLYFHLKKLKPSFIYLRADESYLPLLKSSIKKCVPKHTNDFFFLLILVVKTDNQTI